MGIGIKVAIAAILFSIVSGGYFYIQALEGKLEAAAEVQQRMEGVIEQQKMVLEQNQKDLQKMQEVNNQVAEVAQSAQQEVNEMRNKFSRFNAIAKNNPTEAEMRINRGTKDALRCNEIVTGSRLTADEISGKIQNNICPELIKTKAPKKEAAK
jgi:uncharacterized protein (UPF0333 family)